MKKISSDFSIAGQIPAEEVAKLAEQGFKSVLNLRGAGEAGFLDETDVCKNHNLEYAHVPMAVPLQVSAFHDAVQKLHSLPKPVLVHCASAARASVVVFAEMNEGKQGAELVQAVRELKEKHSVTWAPGVEAFVDSLKN